LSLRAFRAAMRVAGKAALPCPDQGNMTMPTAGRAHRTASFTEFSVTPPRACRSALRPQAALVRKLLALAALSCAVALGGCASRSPAPELQAEHVQPAAERPPEVRIRRPARALLTPQRAPDCEFRESSSLKPVDPDQWERLKLAYERQCYRDAEQATRKRLARLQAASLCRIEPVAHSSPAVR
jgi:hypothetical protein